MKKYILIALAVVALASCEKQMVSEKESAEIEFHTSITKVTQTAFESGDKMSVWAVEQTPGSRTPLQISGNFINNQPVTFNGTKWKSARALYWSEKACDFYALYPYNGNVDSVEDLLYSLPLDQNTPKTSSELGGYERADLLYARSENVTRKETGVSLDFGHIMSRCSVVIRKGEDFTGEITDDISVHLYNTVTEFHLDLKKGSVGKNAFGARNTITMQKLDNQHFRAIVVPQNIESSTPLIEMTMGGISYLLHGELSFRPGYNHTLTLTLNTSPDQEKIDISITPGVDNWN